MKVLLAHNAYLLRGGEDAVFEAEAALLRAHGHTVLEYRRHNDELQHMGRAAAAMETLWSRRTSADLEALIDAEKPDLIHAHNTFPLISPSLYWAAHRAGVPVVQTLHNFRLLCPQAMLLRNGKVCEDCVGKLPWRGVLRSCYRDSVTQSAAVAAMLSLHRSLGTWKSKVARFIALNEFSRKKFIEGGLPDRQIVVKPNFADFPKTAERERTGFAYVGRLSPEKGIGVLALAARAVSDLRFRVLGTGPAKELLVGIGGLELMGASSRDQVVNCLKEVNSLIFPSIWFETFGLVIVEAFANSTPVIASRIGGVPELVEDGVTGLLFAPGDAYDLANKLRWAQSYPEKMAEMGRTARARFEEKYSPDRNYSQLMAIYADVLGLRGQDCSGAATTTVV